MRSEEVRVLSADDAGRGVPWEELWNFRDLLYFLVWRDVKARYRQTVLGASWALIQPFVTMIVFTIFFGRLAGIPSDGVPYPIFSYAALLPWTFLASAVVTSSSSMVINASLISKVYFPRIFLPLAATITPVVDLAIAFSLLLVMMIYYGIEMTPGILLVPLWIAWAWAAALGIGLWMAALNVQFRDVRFLLPFGIQLWLLASPVAYPVSSVPEPWRWLYFTLNPMVGVIEGFRSSILGTPSPGLTSLFSLIPVVVIGIGGFRYFRRVEGTFADVI